MRLPIAAAAAAAVRSTTDLLTSMARDEGLLSVGHTRSASSNIRQRPQCTKSMSVRHQSEACFASLCRALGTDGQLTDCSIRYQQRTSAFCQRQRPLPDLCMRLLIYYAHPISDHLLTVINKMLSYRRETALQGAL